MPCAFLSHTITDLTVRPASRRASTKVCCTSHLAKQSTPPAFHDSGGVVDPPDERGLVVFDLCESALLFFAPALVVDADDALLDKLKVDWTMSMTLLAQPLLPSFVLLKFHTQIYNRKRCFVIAYYFMPSIK